MNTKKLTKWLALYLPYILLGLVATNLGEAWRLAEGKGLGDKIMAMMGTLPLAFANPLPSLPPLDLLVGFFCGAGLRLAVYLRSKNAKKYRHGMEYGSARWGTPKDIEPFQAPKFADNIILTKTERLMMSNRPPEIEREYTPAEFDSLSDGIRKEMGLRPFSLSKLKPANQYQAHTAKQMEFQNFCFAYKKREPESLHIPSAELPVGETIAIIGLNGAGKSTLARCICGLEKKCGLLQVDGKTLDWKARLKHCYMVMQDTSHQLFTESVTDEVLLSMDNKDETVVDKILKQFDLLEYKDRHPLSLSGGQKQRVAIASAIVSNREIIVFDEPTSGLDLKHMREVARSLKSLADQGKTLLVITHDPELVMAGCSYVVHMEKGQIKESYPLDESGSKKVLDFFRIRQ